MNKPKFAHVVFVTFILSRFIFLAFTIAYSNDCCIFQVLINLRGKKKEEAKLTYSFLFPVSLFHKNQQRLGKIFDLLKMKFLSVIF